MALTFLGTALQVVFGCTPVVRGKNQCKGESDNVLESETLRQDLRPTFLRMLETFSPAVRGRVTQLFPLITCVHGDLGVP